MNSTASLSSSATELAQSVVARPAEINVFTMLVALGFPAEVAATAARPDTFAH